MHPTNAAASRAMSFQRARRLISTRLPAGNDGSYEQGYRDALVAMLLQLQPAAVRTDDVEAAVTKALDSIGTGVGTKVQLGVFSAEQIGTVNMLDIVGECDPTGGQAEWDWLDKHARFKSCGEGAFGGRVAVLHLSPEGSQAPDLDGAPPLLVPLIQEAQTYGLSYLTFCLQG